MAFPLITPLPLPPTRQDPENFVDRADAFLAALPDFQEELNAFGAEGDLVSQEVSDNAAIAQAAVNTIASLSGLAEWDDVTVYDQYDVAIDPIDFQNYRRKTAGSSATSPSLDPTNWEKISGAQSDVSAAGNNTFSGDNEFTQPLTVASPTLDTHAATKLYADGKLSLGGGDLTGPLTVPAGAENTQVPRAEEVVRIRGGAARFPSWNTAGRPVSPEIGDTGRNTTYDCNETWNGSHWVPDRWISLGSFTATGTAVDIADLDLLPWIREVKITFKEITHNSGSTQHFIVRLDGGAGVITTGYLNTSFTLVPSGTIVMDQNTDGFRIRAVSSIAIEAEMRLSKSSSSNKWSCVSSGTGTSGVARILQSQGVSSDIGDILHSIRFAITGGSYNGGAFDISVRA